MATRSLFAALIVMMPLLVAGCGLKAESPNDAGSFYKNEEHGYIPPKSSSIRPVEGFHAAPFVAIAPPVIDEPVDLAPKARPGAGGLGRLSGHSLRLITDALNQHGEGERIGWYEDEHQYQMRIDSHQYVQNARFCKDVMLLKKRNNQHSQWGRHFVTFCRAKPNSPWKLMG